MTFSEELRELINRYSKDGGSNTPDFILMEYLIKCLNSFDEAVSTRDKWYGVHLCPGDSYFLRDKTEVKK